MQSVTCVMVGAKGVGKTCLGISYTTEAFPGEYVPEVFEAYEANVMWNGMPIKLHITDTPGGFGEPAVCQRASACGQADVALLCYSLVDERTVDELPRYCEELRAKKPAVRLVVVGLKADRLDGAQPADQQPLAKKLGAAAQLTCSALTQEGLKSVFDTAIASVLGAKPATPSRRRLCSVC